MARQYVITETEYQALLDKLELPVESLARGFHMVVVRWAQEMGFDGRRK